MVAEIIDLESAILTVTAGYPPDPRWAGRSSAKALTEKLRILIQDLTTPADDRYHPSSEWPMPIRTCVITFSDGSLRRRESIHCPGTALFC